MSRAGFNRTTALATVTMTLAAEAADIDILGYAHGRVFGFAHHRGITHAFVGVPFVAAFTLLLIYLIYRVRIRFGAFKPKAGYPQQPRWGVLYGLALIACLSHILLDFSNNYGVRPFEPFSYKWYAWDTVFIFEPLLYVALIGGLALPTLFSLVQEEIGARRRGPKGRAGAIIALIGVVAVWTVRDYQHRKAVSMLEASVYHGEDPVRVAAMPYPLNPFRWYGIVETDDFFERFELNSANGDVDPTGRAQTRFKPEETDATRAAKGSYLGRIYLDWARFPLTEVERLNSGGYVVRFQDLRFSYPDTSRRPLRATVELNSALGIEGEWWGQREQGGVSGPADTVR